jgi:carboxypeptidase C (cathepsin A)
MQVSGHRVDYKAAVAEWPVYSTDGETVGVMVTESYVNMAAPEKRLRPVTFIYNGGPGASSWALQMEGLGPRIYNPQTGRFDENPDTLLDATDLVFIDPLGTGASFPMAGSNAIGIWNTPGDARSIRGVIEDWLRANDRTDSPQFLLGESYGTMRTLAIMHEDASHPELNVHGVVLLSLFLSTATDADVEAIALLPSLATAAYAHGVRPAGGASVQEVYEDALTFARTTYAGALSEGSSLTDPHLNQVAQAMSEQIGIPPDLLVSTRLHVSRSQAMHSLALPGKLQHTGALDARVLGGVDIDSLPPPYDDPSMLLGRHPGRLMEEYLASLGYTIAGPYRPLNLFINQQYWYFSKHNADGEDFGFDSVPWLVDAMKADPRLQVFSAGGYYDTNTPLAVGKYLLDHAEIDRSRWTAKAYASGHGITEDPIQRSALARDLRAFIAQTESRYPSH